MTDLIFQLHTPEEFRHLIMFNLLFGVGIIELLLSLGKMKNKMWFFIWPGVLLIITYNEPEGAYKIDSSQPVQHEGTRQH